MSEMSKERLVAFTDVVLAIIMTILVLELERPSELTWSALWELKTNFFAYTISFFWLGTMWVICTGLGTMLKKSITAWFGFP